MQTTLEQPRSFTPKTVSVMGAGEEIRDIEKLRHFHTPTENDGGQRDYHSHADLTSHYSFAKAILDFARQYGLEIDDIAFKVDKVVEDTITTKSYFGYKSDTKVTIAQRFFLIARIRNPEYQLADDVETFIIARNSHDKRLPMEVAIGNKVIVCSNLLFGGDISIKAKNSAFGYANLQNRLHDLFKEYLGKVDTLKKDIEYFKGTTISEVHGLAFIAHHSNEAKFIQKSRTASVCDMFINPEHSPEYQYEDGSERYSLWRILNAYTYVHRGELVIDPETNTHHADQRRTQVCPLELKREFTKELWARLRATKYAGFVSGWYKNV